MDKSRSSSKSKVTRYEKGSSAFYRLYLDCGHVEFMSVLSENHIPKELMCSKCWRNDMNEENGAIGGGG